LKEGIKGSTGSPKYPHSSIGDRNTSTSLDNFPILQQPFPNPRREGRIRSLKEGNTIREIFGSEHIYPKKRLIRGNLPTQAGQQRNYSSDAWTEGQDLPKPLANKYYPKLIK
jgi:hypothetical protein